MINALTQKYYRNLQKTEMVKYWQTKDAIEAKLTKSPEGHMVMMMDGEKYPFPGHPRGSLLFGKLSPLKHQIKNQIFNELWRLLEEKTPDAGIATHLQRAWENIFDLAKETKYDLVPFDLLVPPVKELWRAMEKVGVNPTLKEIVCFIFQEDDAYRMRFQWMAKFYPLFGKPTRKHLSRAFDMMEQAEVVDDMKERIRLVKRGFLYMANDKLDALLKEINWKKVGLSKADKYFFRAKWFKVDYPEYQY